MEIPEYQDDAELLHDENDIVYQLENQKERWTITSLSSAHWVDEMIHERELIIEEKEKIANETIAALEAKIEKQKQWLERATKKEKSDIDFFLTHLKLYHMNIIDQEKAMNIKLKSEDKKERPLTKTIKLPYRDLTSKVQLPEIVRNNEEELIKWVQDNHTKNIPLEKITSLIDAKNLQKESHEDDVAIMVSELLDIVKEYDTSYIKRENKLAWGEWKKTLSQHEVSIKATNEEGDEQVVGTKLVYFDENGSEVPHVELLPKEDKFDWKPVKD